jgi:hypothetical protein
MIASSLVARARHPTTVQPVSFEPGQAMSGVQIASTASGRDIAYRVMSRNDGPALLFMPEGTAPVDLLDEDPMHDRFATPA